MLVKQESVGALEGDYMYSSGAKLGDNVGESGVD